MPAGLYEEIRYVLKFNLSSQVSPILKYAAHSSLVDYLAQVINAKNCPTTFFCIFQLVWVPMTTTPFKKLYLKKRDFFCPFFFEWQDEKIQTG